MTDEELMYATLLALTRQNVTGASWTRFVFWRGETIIGEFAVINGV